MELIKLQSLRRKFELMHMEDDQKIAEYISKLISIVNQMKACGEAMTDQQIVEKIMWNNKPGLQMHQDCI